MPTPTDSAVDKRWTLPWILLVGLVIVLASYLRLDGLGEPSLWFDEILHVEKAATALNEPWHAWFTGLGVDNENGSLYYATQSLALRIRPDEVGARLMPALAGIATVGVLFAAGLAATGDRRSALIAATLLALSPLHVYYSREARPYSAVILMASLLMSLLLIRRRSWSIPAVYCVCIATAYLGAVAAPVLLTFAILALGDWIWRRREHSTWPGHFFLAAAAGLALGLFLFPSVHRITTASASAEMIVTPPLSALAADRLLASLTVSGVEWATSNPRSYLFVAFALLGLFRLARTRRASALAVVGMLILPISIWQALLVILNRWYNVRYTSAGLPALLLLAAIGIVALAEVLSQAANRLGVRRQACLPLALAGLMTVTLAGPGWAVARTEPRQKPDWKGLVERLGLLAKEREPIVAQDWWAEKCLQHYLSAAGLDLAVHDSLGDPDRARQLIPATESAWLVAAGYVRAEKFRHWMHTADPIVRSRLANLELFFHPDFHRFAMLPARTAGISKILGIENETGPRRDFGTSEILLGTGWSYPEIAQDGTTFRWAAAPTTEIGVLRSTEDESLLRLRMLPFPSPDLPHQTVEVRIDSEPVDPIQLEPGWHVYEIEVPEALWRIGPNLIEFRFGWQQSPADLNPQSADPRELAVAFDFVEVVRRSAD